MIADIESQRTHYEDALLASDPEYDTWLNSLNRLPEQYIIIKRNGQYIAYGFVKHIVDNGAIGIMPGDHKQTGFCASEIVSITDSDTRSFAYSLAISEYVEDEFWNEVPF